jgi:hypothetical protein
MNAPLRLSVFGVLTAVALSALPAASASAASCDKAGYKTLDQNRYVRVQRGPIPKGDSTSDFGYYACRLKSGKRYLLGGNECFGNDLGSVGDYALAGNYIAYEARTCGDPEGESDATRLNVSTGVRGKASAESGPLPGGGVQDFSITGIVVKGNGNMAWIALKKQVSGGNASTYEVRRAIGAVSDTVGTGPAIAADSLALSSSTIFWLDGATPKSASLP